KEPHAGDTTLTLSQPATNWAVGNTVDVLDSTQEQWDTNAGPPGTGYGNFGFVLHREIVTISAISGDGKTLTLSQSQAFSSADGKTVIKAPALQYDHPGAHNA